MSILATLTIPASLCSEFVSNPALKVEIEPLNGLRLRGYTVAQHSLDLNPSVSVICTDG